jgi:signal transduction histidine kinase
MSDDNALATTAGKAAHDFKNLLAIILGNTELIEEVATDADTVHMLRLIREAAERGNALADELGEMAARVRDDR